MSHVYEYILCRDMACIENLALYTNPKCLQLQSNRISKVMRNTMPVIAVSQSSTHLLCYDCNTGRIDLPKYACTRACGPKAHTYVHHQADHKCLCYSCYVKL